MRQVEPHEGIARLHAGEEYRHVGLCARVGLHIGVVGHKELAGPFACDILHHVHALAAAVIAVSGVALGIFVGQHAAHRFHYCGADKVFGSNQFNFIALASEFFTDSRSNFGVTYCKFFQIHLSPSMSFIKLHN